MVLELYRPPSPAPCGRRGSLLCGGEEWQQGQCCYERLIDIIWKLPLSFEKINNDLIDCQAWLPWHNEKGSDEFIVKIRENQKTFSLDGVTISI